MSTPAYAGSSASVLSPPHQQRRGTIGLPSAVLFAFAMSLTWLIFYNVRFWEDSLQAMWHGTAASAAFLASLLVLVLCVQALLLLLLPRRLMVPGASVLFLVAAFSSFFSLHYGVVMNKDMMRNVLQTDIAEAEGLLSLQLAHWVMLLGVLPAALIWKVRLPVLSWKQAMRQRTLAISAIVAISIAALFAASSSYAVYFREHKPIRFTLAPAAPISAALQLLIAEYKTPPGPAINVSGAARRVATPRARPLALLIVIGETARAENFQLGGYDRPTNPQLSQLSGVTYFDNVTSCGTATAVSVPCIFSPLPRSEFSVDDARRYMNLLDALAAAGFDVEWRDNNAGCKGVCARVTQVSYAQRKDSSLCNQDYCHDEILLEGLEERLRNLQRDTVFVLHMIGSHGPAYASRYPKRFEQFTPVCQSSQLQRCSTQEIVNAYDNSILYTDFVLSQAIAKLRNAAGHVDSALLYVSDHGESLGEQGIYLHGMPYRFAPDVQKHVPMLLWTSIEYARERHLDADCLSSLVRQPASHDNVYHTVLGAAEVRNDSYDATLDLFSRCAAALPADHE